MTNKHSIFKSDGLFPQAAHVRLEVCNTLGQMASLVVKREMPAGHRVVQWDGNDGSGNNLASDVYLYRIHSSFGEETKKTVFLKQIVNQPLSHTIGTVERSSLLAWGRVSDRV